MTLRCPYCKKTFGPDPVATCPHCGKTMVLPDRLLKRSYRERQRAKDCIRREYERKKRELGPRIPRGRRPSTLLIALAVMVLVGVLLIGRTNMKFPAYDRTQKTFDERVINDLRALRIAVERFHEDCGRYPTKREGLRGLVRNPGRSGWRGPYITLLKPDPWGMDYLYAREADGTVNVRSAGPDTTAGTSDDIVAETPSTEEIAR